MKRSLKTVIILAVLIVAMLRLAIITVVDPDGCILNSKTVNGPFENPEVKEVSVVERTILRSLKKFFQTKCYFVPEETTYDDDTQI